MGKLGEGLKKVMLAGVGGAAITAEKSVEILDELLEKMTPEQLAQLKERIQIMEGDEKEEACQEEACECEKDTPEEPQETKEECGELNE